jgi:hypothetical protein
LGGLIHFPRTAALRGESDWQNSADDLLRPTRNTSEVSLLTWIDAKRSRDGDDDGDGGDGGGRAA